MAEFVRLSKELGASLAKGGDADIPRVRDLLSELSTITATVQTLKESRIGITIAKLLKHSDEDLRAQASEMMKGYKVQIAAARRKSGGSTGPTKKKAPTPKAAAAASSSSSASAHDLVIPLPREGPSQRRMQVRKILLKLFGTNVQLAADLEQAVFDKFKSATDSQYNDKLRSLRFNLKKNQSLCHALLQKRVSVEKLMAMSSEDMLTRQEQAARSEADAELFAAVQTDWMDHNRDKVAKSAGMELTAGLVTCGKCKGTNTSFFQKQTRSADEPMTNFCTCHNTKCGHKWRFC
jgi:transcription elongation factor S-II